jgi:phosphatidylserine/phosphatidylglycerophosphate/cardiolipin synthase-like enzyme
MGLATAHVTDQNLQTAKLLTVIKTPNDSFRNYLAGPLGKRLVELLTSAAKDKRDIYAALYELDDEQLEAALEKCGNHAHVLLANGSVKKKGQDQNHDARARLEGKIDLHGRMISPRALGHNKFLVIGDKNNKPCWVWTGSQNWTKTGLCTQANNSVLIDNPRLAAEYRAQWDRLLTAADETTDDLKQQQNSEPRDPRFAGSKVRLWFTPTMKQMALKEARDYSGGKADDSLLEVQPGAERYLAQRDHSRCEAGTGARRLYIHGAINQDPSTTQTPVELFDRDNSEKADFEVVLPAAVNEPTKFFRRELKKLPRAYAMVHSKVVLIDPFGKDPFC